MIKVNLLPKKKNKAKYGSNLFKGSGLKMSHGSPGAPRGDQTKMALKIIVMFLGVGGLFGFQKYFKFKNKKLITTLRMEDQNLTKQVKGYEKIIEEAKLYESDFIVQNKLLTEARRLGKIRLNTLQALDHLQTVIPDGIWMQSLSLSKRSGFNFRGSSESDEEITQFVKGLESSSYFKNVLLVKSVQKKLPNGNVLSFELRSEDGTR